jgi:hypothetical protein
MIIWSQLFIGVLCLLVLFLKRPVPSSRTSDVIVVQTCDGIKYKDILDITSKHHEKYAKLHGYDYIRYDGIKQGKHPWHAAFNRIYMLEDALNQGYKYVLYLDADAVVLQPQRTVLDLLGDNADRLMMITTDTLELGNMNDGVFIMNLQHPNSRTLIELWKKMYEMYLLDDNNNTDVFDVQRNDQIFLYYIFKFITRNSANWVYFDLHAELQGAFSKQSLQYKVFPITLKSMEERIEEVKKMIQEVNQDIKGQGE